MTTHTTPRLTLRSLFLCLLVFNINTYAVEEESSCHEHTTTSSTIWSAINNPIGMVVITYIANKAVFPIIDPIVDYASTSCYNLYVNHWLTPEQREEMRQKQQEEHARLVEDYENATMKHLIIFTESERGKNILLREKEQEIRQNNLTLKENQLTIIGMEREESSKTVAHIEQLQSKTSNPEVQAALQKKLDDEILKWAHSR